MTGSPPSAPQPQEAALGTHFGLLSQQKIQIMLDRGMIKPALPLSTGQLQPASLDLRLGAKAYRVRASFLPGRGRTVAEQLERLSSDVISLEGEGAVLERGCVYVVPLLESLHLPQTIAGIANPKSSTGRLDIFTRLITDSS